MSDPAFQVQKPSSADPHRIPYFSGRRGSVLSSSQFDFYELNGFVVLSDLIAAATLERFKIRFQEICAREVVVPGLTIMRDIAVVKTSSSVTADAENVTKIQDFQFDDVLFGYCTLPQILAIVKDIIGSDNIMAMHTMLINKPPDPGSKSSRHPLHQDLHYFPFRPADRIVCAWMALENVNRANGCLVVIPGSHKGPLLAHSYPEWQGGVNKMYHGIQDYEVAQNRIHLEMKAGDVVFFHPLLVHGSGANKTKGFRKAISCHYAASECYYIDVRGTSQEGISDEVISLAKRRLGDKIEISFEDAWRVRSRLVVGQKSNL